LLEVCSSCLKCYCWNFILTSQNAYYPQLCEQQSADKKFGNVAAYRAYKRTTRLSLFSLSVSFCFQLIWRIN
jgi:hypothetical protein